jgi:hypothetical protein
MDFSLITAFSSVSVLNAISAVATISITVPVSLWAFTYLDRWFGVEKNQFKMTDDDLYYSFTQQVGGMSKHDGVIKFSVNDFSDFEDDEVVAEAVGLSSVADYYCYDDRQELDTSYEDSYEHSDYGYSEMYEQIASESEYEYEYDGWR